MESSLLPTKESTDKDSSVSFYELISLFINFCVVVSIGR